MRRSEINHGDSFSCRIQGRAVTGKVSLSNLYPTHIALCNNIKSQSAVVHAVNDMFGKSGYWWVEINSKGQLDFTRANITDFRITKRAPTLTQQTTKKAPKKAAAKVATTTTRVVARDEETPVQRVARLERELQEARQQQAASSLGAFRSWNITRNTNGTFRFGCGEVELTREQLQAWVTVQRHLNRRGSLTAGNDARIVATVGRKHIVETMNHAMVTAERILNATR